MKFYQKIKKRIILIKEGKTFLDKLKISFSILSLNYYRPEVFLKNVDGIFLVRKNSSDLWMLSPMGEGEIRPYFSLSEGTFLDIGANVGKYSIILGRQLDGKGQVYSFEPEQSNLDSLKKNVELNKLKNIKIIPLACYRKEAKLIFYLNKKNSGGHSLVKKTGQKIFVKADSIDNIVKDKKIKNIRLIKIDVEGAEFDVLRGSEKTLKKYKPKIIFETDFPEKVIPFLKKLGYKVKRISKRDYFAEQSFFN